MKKMLCLALFFLLLLPNISVFAAENIVIGSYVQMGNYSGAPILWRCVDINENGALMISDGIICLKSFDCAGNHSQDTNGIRAISGTNAWKDSTLRIWLNSDETLVNYADGHIPDAASVREGKNAYDAESGFLTNFTAEERKLMRTVTISSPVHTTDAADSGTELHRYIGNAALAATNFSLAYSQTTTDTVFVPSTEDISRIAANAKILGEKYYAAQPTAQTVSESGAGFLGINVNKNWYYWLRDALSWAYQSDEVRCMYPSGGAYNSKAYNGGIGVRPAFYLDADKASLRTGDGSSDNPYCVDTQPMISLRTESEFSTSGASVVVEESMSNIPEDAVFERYINGENVETFEKPVILKHTATSFLTVAKNYEGAEICRSNELIIAAVEQNVKHKYLFADFDTENPMADFTTISQTGVSVEKSASGTNALQLLSRPGTTGEVRYKLPKALTGDLTIEADITLSDFNEYVTRNLFCIYTNGSTNYGRVLPLTFVNNASDADRGGMVLNAAAENYVLADNLETNRSYHIILTISSENHHISVVLDDRVLCYRQPLSYQAFSEFKEVGFLNGTTNSGISSLTIDNLSVSQTETAAALVILPDADGAKLYNATERALDLEVYFVVKDLQKISKQSVEFSEGEVDKLIPYKPDSEGSHSIRIFAWDKELRPQALPKEYTN